MTRTGQTSVEIRTVAGLYEDRERMDVPDYYEAGEENPYNGLCRIIPTKAAYYAMVPEANEAEVVLARSLLRGARPRRKIREHVCDKAEVNYNQFSKAGRIVVLYV